MTGTWRQILTFLKSHGRAVLVTVQRVQGSAPREAGARMVVAPDGRFTGTIGGGTLEWQALAEAQRLCIGERTAATLVRSLGPDLGQCCGGRVTLELRRFDAGDRTWVADLAAAESEGPIGVVVTEDGHRRRLALAGEVASEWFGEPPTELVLFGAGHIGRALMLALAPLPVKVMWVDGRNGAFPDAVPRNVTCISETAPTPVLAAAGDGAIVLAMTHSHALDLAIVAEAFRCRRFRRIGVIGSETKRARFLSQLKAAGFAASEVDALVCPIGIAGLSGKQPAVIALSVAAQIMQWRELETRRESESSVNHGEDSGRAEEWG